MTITNNPIVVNHNNHPMIQILPIPILIVIVISIVIVIVIVIVVIVHLHPPHRIMTMDSASLLAIQINSRLH